MTVLLEILIRFGLGVSFVLFGLLFAAPRLLAPLALLRRVTPERKAELLERMRPWNGADDETRERFDAAQARRRGVARPMSGVMRATIGWTMVVLGMLTILGIVGAAWSAVMVNVGMTLIVLAGGMRTQREGGMRRAALLEPHGRPNLSRAAWIIPFLQVPLLVVYTCTGPRLPTVIVGVASLLMVAAAHLFAVKADRALFNLDLVTERSMDEWTRARSVYNILAYSLQTTLLYFLTQLPGNGLGAALFVAQLALIAWFAREQNAARIMYRPC